jgi:DNA-binding MarR family transcriptional regulator
MKTDAAAAALSALSEEISLNRDFTGLHEAAFLSLAWTWQRLEQLGRMFFPRYGITGAQFNVLMILHDYHGRAFRQHELAEILVVNRASAGTVLDRMHRSGWIERAPDPQDRRAVLVSLADAGRRKLKEVKGPYTASSRTYSARSRRASCAPPSSSSTGCGCASRAPRAG